MLLHGRIAASRVPPKILTMVLRLRRCGRSLAALRIRCDPRNPRVGAVCPRPSPLLAFLGMSLLLWLGVNSPVLAQDSGPPPAPPTEKPPPPSSSERLPGTESWKDDVYTWMGPRLVGTLVAGGICVGFLAAGDIIIQVRIDESGEDYARTLGYITHIPPGMPEDVPARDAVRSLMGEGFLDAGLQGTLPIFGTTLPVLVAAQLGGDLRTVKTVGAFAGAASFIPTGVFHLERWRQIFLPQWEALSDGKERFFFFVPGIVSLGFGIADVAMGMALLVRGSMVAADAAPEPTTRPSLFARTAVPWFAPSGDGGVMGITAAF